MENTNLKARLFELLDEKETMKARVEKAEREAKEYMLQVDDVRGELRMALQVAERRSEMVRELSKENRMLRQASLVRTPVKTGLTEETVEQVMDVLRKEVRKSARVDKF